MRSELLIWQAWLTSHLAAARTSRDERGEISQTVIITAVLAAAAIAITAIIVAKFTSKAESIPTQ